jgi:transcriptional regulator with XRE-family HTH domain
MNRIKELRKQNHYTLQNVADAVGVSNGTVANYENGKREPKLAMWKKIADYFGVSIGYLQGISEFPDNNLDVFGDEISDARKYAGKILSIHKEEDSDRLSRMLMRVTSDENINHKIDNNLSDMNDRLLVYDLLEGVKSGVSAILVSDIGLKKHKKDLEQVHKELNIINDRLLKMYHNDID